MLKMLFILFVLSTLAGCERRGWPNFSIENYKKTIASAKTALPVAVQIEELFGAASTDHFITNDADLASKPKVWNSEVYFGDRYRLTMQVDVQVDYENNVVTMVGKPKFYLYEITKVNGDAASLHGEHAIFEMDKWQKFYDSKGNFSELGLTKNPTSVPNFKEFANGVRRDRVLVSLLPPLS